MDDQGSDSDALYDEAEDAFRDGMRSLAFRYKRKCAKKGPERRVTDTRSSNQQARERGGPPRRGAAGPARPLIPEGVDRNAWPSPRGRVTAWLRRR